MKKITNGFVILHYIAYKTSCTCIDNVINNLDVPKIKIVVVDNASPNGSGKKLLERYKNFDYIQVILNKKNLGFARGNNIGYNYLKEHFETDYITVLNNDVFITDTKYLERIEQIYFETKFDVLGPDIFCISTKQHQSPLRLPE